MKNLLVLFTLVAVLIFASGCLTVEKKEYTFTINKDKSGTLTIKFINIISIMDDETDVSQEDFNDLIYTYYEGGEFESVFPNARLVNKVLFEENGQLCAEVRFEFDDYRDANLYVYSKKSPYMYSLCGFLDAESYETSNGEFGGENMPVVFWSEKLKELHLTTTITQPDETTVGLLDKYNDWKLSQ